MCPILQKVLFPDELWGVFVALVTAVCTCVDGQYAPVYAGIWPVHLKVI